MMTHNETDTHGIRFLIVEDRTVTAIELECMLEEQGHSVVAVAVVPALAERVLKQQSHCIDAVILGAEQVGITSLPMVQKLVRRGMPVVITSQKPASKLRAMGFDAPVLEKPFRPEDIARVTDALNIPKSASAA